MIALDDLVGKPLGFGESVHKSTGSRGLLWSSCASFLLTGIGSEQAVSPTTTVLNGVPKQGEVND
jgi:hypothetical protein